MSAIAEFVGVVNSGEGYVQGIMPQGVSESGESGESEHVGDDGEEPDVQGCIKDVIDSLNEWGDEIGAWFTEAYQQSQIEGASRALVPIPPALPPALIGAIIGLPAAPVLIPFTIGIAVLSKVAQGWLSYRNVAQFQDFLSAFRQAFLASGESIPARINETLTKLDAEFTATVDGKAVSLAELMHRATTVTNPDGTTDNNILERILRALEALQYNDEEIDLGGVHIALRSKYIAEP